MTAARPPATIALIGVCAAVFLATEYLHWRAVPRMLFIAVAAAGLTEIAAGQWWRLFTPILLHADLFHFIFNMMWIWLFGQLIESRHGAAALLLLTAALAAPSNLAQFWVSGPWFGGMSAVVYGYLGYLLVQGKFNPDFGAQLQPQVVFLLLGWFAVCWSGVLEFFGMHIANVAHTAGLLSGLVIGGVCVVCARLKLRA